MIASCVGWQAACGTCANTAAAFTDEQALAHAKGQSGWRLPNVKELASIVDRARSNPSIDPLIFPGTVSNWYWSSSPLAGYPDYAWIVYFYSGSVSYYYRNYNYHVRLVR